MGDVDYFEEALSLFYALNSFHTDYLKLADRTIQLNTPSAALRELFLPAIAHLITAEGGANTELTIWYAEDKDLPRRLKAPPGQLFNAQGYREGDDDSDVQVFFWPWQHQVFLYSRSRRTGIYWVANIKDIPWWETTFSFRPIFHLWTRDLPAQLVHAGAIANENFAVLITGPSGSGKSTSCLNLLRSGYNYLGDDYVWMELEPEPVVYALYQTAKLEANNFSERFADWRPFLKNPESYLSEKAIFDMKEVLPGQWLPKATVKAILLPSVSGHEQTTFQRISSSNAFFGMAPTTLHHLPHHRNTSYQKLLRLSSLLPSYSWHLGFNVTQFQHSFTNFMKNELS